MQRRRIRAFSPFLLLLLAVLTACQAAAPPPTARPPEATLVTANPTLVPTQTPTAVPSPTPNPVVIKAQADRARFEGDIEKASQLLAEAERLQPAASDAQSETRFQRARLQYETDDLSAAIGTLQTLISDTRAVSPTHPSLGIYFALLGRANESAANPPEAAANYVNAINSGSVISPYLNLWLGNYYVALNTPISAVVPYQNAVALAPNVSVEFERREKLALALTRSGQFTAALSQYDEILSRAKFPTYRARILWESAQAMLAAGQGQSGYARLRELVTEYERTPQAYLALVALLDAKQPVDELQRGRVNFHAKSYQAARDAFRRAIQTDTARADEIRLWAARNYDALGLPNDAIRNLDPIIAANKAGSDKATEALIVKAEVLLNAGNMPAALKLVPQIQTGTATAAALFQLALAFERAGQAEAASGLYAAGNALPDTTLPLLSRAREATLLSQLNRHTEAEAALLRLLAQPNNDATSTSRMRFWLSKTQIAAGNTVTGERTLRALAADFPDTYEGVRAAQLISASRLSSDSRPFAPPPDDEGQPDAEAWLRSWNGLSDTVEIRSAGPTLTGDARFLRGNALWRLGFEPEAVQEFGALIGALTKDPIGLYQLALHLRGLGAYRMSIQAADTLMRISPTGAATAKLPIFLARLVYPVYYADLVQAAAKEFNLDPMLVFSVIRQESLFEAFAESSAAASGLMQVIPTTGAEINRELGWPANYSQRDLPKPFVSVRFGTYYLAKQRRLFDSDVYAMLAAYNGGPGNALRWKERAGSDPDAFVETVTFEETRRYIINITVNVAIYQRLYPVPGA